MAKLAERDAQIAERDNTIALATARLSERETQLAKQEAELARREAELQEKTSEYTRLWNAYERLKEELALVKRRMFIAKAERVDTTSLQLEFDDLVKRIDALAAMLPAPTDGDDEEQGDESKPSKKGHGKAKPKGRRNLADADLPEVQLQIEDALMEQLVAEGKAERIGLETSYKLSYERGGLRKLVLERVKYRAVTADGSTEIETAEMPAELVSRCLAAPSTLAHIATSKFCDGLPLYRLEDILGRHGASVDRGTMSRWLEHLGATFGATVVHAAHKDALENAFCIMTDATGFAVQPGPRDKGEPRRPCRKGHYFVQIADRDHVFFEFTERHTSEAVRGMFKGFDGYIQADASNVYDALFRPTDPDSTDDEDDGCTRIEVACWSHARRKFWEAALAKQLVAREALVWIGKIFEMDAGFRKNRPPPSKIKSLRQTHLKPVVDEFLAFAEREYKKVEHQRGSLRSALGYCLRQADALGAFLADGRLRLDNNLSEGQLRKVVRIRDASLFAGSSEHAEAAGHILSLIASARMHDLDPELYLRDLIRVLPHWPRDRYLELAAKYWAHTRALLDPRQLATELGALDVPDARPLRQAE